jgi:hypothetical protein
LLRLLQEAQFITASSSLRESWERHKKLVSVSVTE